MKVFLKIVFWIVILYCISCAALLFEEDYRQFIRYIYENLSSNKLIFHRPGKYFHFASGEFVLAPSLFFLLLYFFLRNRNKKKQILRIITTVILFFVSIVFLSFIDSQEKLAECTACPDGTRVLTYEEINYDLLFIISLILALLPSILEFTKTLLETKKHSKTT